MVKSFYGTERKTDNYLTLSGREMNGGVSLIAGACD